MQINNIEIIDFKNIEYLKIYFKNINLISGKNGSGKSALMEAITLILANHLNDKVGEYIRGFENKKDKKFYINCDMNHLGQNLKYSIIGTNKDYKRKLIINNDENNVYKNAEVTKYMKTILNPTLTLFSAVSEQWKTPQLLFETGSNRLEKFKLVFGIDKINLVGDDIKKSIDDNNINIDKLKTEVSVLESREFNFYDIPKLPSIDLKELIIKEKELEILKQKYQEEKYKYDRYLEDLKKYEDAQLIINDLNKQINNLNLDIKNKKNSFKEVENFDKESFIKLKQEVNDKEKYLIELKNNLNNYNNAQSEIKKIKNKIENIKKEISECIIERVSRLGFTEDDLKMLQKNVNDLFIKVKQLENKNDAIKNGLCDKCGATYNSVDIDENIKELELKREDYKIKNQELIEKQKKLDIYKKITNNNAIISEKKLGLEKQIQNYENNIKDLTNIKLPDNYDSEQKLLEELKEKYNGLEVEFDNYNHIIENNNSIEKNIIKLENNLEILNVKIEENNKLLKPEEFKFTVNYDEKEHNKIKQDIIDYNSILSEIEKIEKLNETLREEEKQNRIKIDKSKDKIDELNLKNSLFTDTRKIIIKDFAAYLIDKGSIYIKKKMNEFFQKSYRKYMITFKQDKNSLDFFYGPSEEHRKSVNMASGHEKTILAVSFRNALCSLQDLGVMLLDEADSQADDEMSNIMFNTLLSDNKDQFFIVTHNESSKELIMNDYNANLIDM